jgi:glycosyltransferase involved in cell wall biosynthesis
MGGVRIAIDARYAGIRPSGIGRYTEALLERLPGAIAVEAWLHPSARVPHRELVVRRVASRANHLPTLWWPAKLSPLGEVDVFHAPFNILGRGIPCPTVVTIHDLMWLDAPALCQRRPLLRAVQRRFFESGIRRALSADRIIVPSRATADAIAARDPTLRVTVIPHGVDPTWRPAADPEAARARCAALGLDRPFFLAVGQNAPYKNHEAIAAAFVAADLARECSLVVVQRLARSPRPGVVSFSTLAEADLRALVQSAIATIQFSRHEGFGLPALEAMASGTPVIVSDIPALRELASNAAEVVPLRIEALAEALRRMARDPSLRADLAARGLERARAFDWDAAAAMHLDVYRDAAGVPSSRRETAMAMVGTRGPS